MWRVERSARTKKAPVRSARKNTRSAETREKRRTFFGNADVATSAATTKRKSIGNVATISAHCGGGYHSEPTRIALEPAEIKMLKIC